MLSEECCLWDEQERGERRVGGSRGSRRGALENSSSGLFMHSVEGVGEGQGAWERTSGFSAMSR